MDPVQKAVISHTFGVPSPLKKKPFISCNICHLRFNSANQAEAHYKGHKHARRLKAIEAVKNKQKAAALANSRDTPADFPVALDASGDPPGTVHASGFLQQKETDAERSSLVLTPPSEESSAELSSSLPALVSPPVSELSEGPSDAASLASSATLGAETPASELGGSVGSAPDGEKEGKKNKQHLYCPTCKVTVNSVSQLEAHNTGLPLIVCTDRGTPAAAGASTYHWDANNIDKPCLKVTRRRKLNESNERNRHSSWGQAQVCAGGSEPPDAAGPGQGRPQGRAQVQKNWQQGQPRPPEQGVPLPSVCDLRQLGDPAQTAREQQETQRQACWEATQTKIQPIQQAPEECCPRIQAGFAEAPHQNLGRPLSAKPPHCRCHVRHAWPTHPPASHRHHPLPSPTPWTSALPNAARPRPCHARPYRLHPLLEPHLCSRRG